MKADGGRGGTPPATFVQDRIPLPPRGARDARANASGHGVPDTEPTTKPLTQGSRKIAATVLHARRPRTQFPNPRTTRPRPVVRGPPQRGRGGGPRPRAPEP